MSGALECESITAAGVHYTIDPETNSLEGLDDSGGEFSVATGLTTIMAFTVHSHDDDIAAFVTGCDGSDCKVVVFTDQNSAGRADSLAGSYTLAAGTRLIALTARLSTCEVFGIDELGDRIVRLLDTSGDFVPDTASTYEQGGGASSLVDDPIRLWIEPNGVLLVTAMESAADLDVITVLQDADADGVAEIKRSSTLFEEFYPGPQLRETPLSGAQLVAVAGLRGATLQVWKTDSNGVKTSADPLVAMVGEVTLAVDSPTGDCTTQLSVVDGDYLRVFDVTHARAGVAREVMLAHPIVSTVSPREIGAAAGGTIELTGTGFSSNTEAELIGPKLGEPLAITVVAGSITPTSIQFVVPTLDALWQGIVKVRVFDQNSPAHESVVEMIVTE